MPADLDRRLAYALLRVALGVNILLHGAIRIAAGLGGFVDATARQFAATPLPDPAVRALAFVIPPAELAIGGLLFIGWHTRWALVAGAVLMIILVAGTAVREDWPTLATQMLYLLLYYLLLRHRDDDWFGVDARSHRNP
ncbi:MAG TPA: DoxX family protein [Gemmatimonadaceae bacterium]|nr:DoxX family protein [Gemmatimonadaceae bacterium]